VLLFALMLAAPADPSNAPPEFVVYQRNMTLPDVPVVYPGGPGGLAQSREAEYKWFGISPLRQYRHVIRYVASWQGGHETATRPWVNKYIVQIALAGDGSRAQVLLLESETPTPARRSPVTRTIGWLPSSEFANVRRQVLQTAASLAEPEEALEQGSPYCTHSSSTRLELHSAGPARIELTREADCQRPASTYAAGEHVIKAAERALGRTIRRP
jgi:hypothetical protein